MHYTDLYGARYQRLPYYARLHDMIFQFANWQAGATVACAYVHIAAQDGMQSWSEERFRGAFLAVGVWMGLAPDNTHVTDGVPKASFYAWHKCKILIKICCRCLREIVAAMQFLSF